jgi:hypothetical protein
MTESFRRETYAKAVDALDGQPLLASRPGQPAVDIVYVTWRGLQVFKRSHEIASAGLGC